MAELKFALILAIIASISAVTNCQCTPNFLCDFPGAVSIPANTPTALANRQYRKCQSTGNEFDQGATYACPATSICLRNLTTGTGGTIVATGTNYNIIADPTATAGPCAPKIPCNGTGSFGFGPQDCELYYSCTGVNAPLVAEISYSRCSRGQHFSPTNRTCMPIETAGCLPAVQPPVCNGPGRLADPTSCRHFYKCGIFGGRRRVRCLFNMRFDTGAERCQRNAACGTRPLLS